LSESVCEAEWIWIVQMAKEDESHLQKLGT